MHYVIHKVHILQDSFNEACPLSWWFWYLPVLWCYSTFRWTTQVVITTFYSDVVCTACRRSHHCSERLKIKSVINNIRCTTAWYH